MKQKVTRLTRQELYDLVWSKPLRRIAVELNISDVGLAKICERHDIPRPAMGHWMKLAHGQKPKTEPLPPPSSAEGDVIEIKGIHDERKVDALYAGEVKEFQEVQHRLIKTQIPASGGRLHPLLLETRKELLKARPDVYGMVGPFRRTCIDLSVARPSLDRALKILDPLFRLLEGSGLQIRIRAEDYVGTYVNVSGEDVQISMREKVKRSEATDAPTTPTHSYLTTNRYTYHPTGILYFRIQNVYSSDIQKQWSDADSEKLENRIVDIGRGIVQTALHLRIRRLEQEQDTRKREEQRRLLEAEEEKRKREEARLKKLLKDAQDWHTSQTLRSYIEAVRRICADEGTELSRKQRVEKWIDWANSEADRLDPVRKMANLEWDEEE